MLKKKVVARPLKKKVSTKKPCQCKMSEGGRAKKKHTSLKKNVVAKKKHTSLKKKVVAKKKHTSLKKKVVAKKKHTSLKKKGGSDWLAVNYARGPYNTPASDWDSDGAGPIGWLNSQQLQQKSCSGGAKKQKKEKKVATATATATTHRGGGSDWLTVHNARGPSNTPGPWDNPSPTGWSNNRVISWMNRNDPLQCAGAKKKVKKVGGGNSTFSLFSRSAQDIPSTKLAYAVAPQMTGATPSCVGGAKKKMVKKKVVSKKKVATKKKKVVAKKRHVKKGGSCSPTFATFAPCSEYVPNEQLAKWIAPQLTGSVASMCPKN